MKKNLKRIFFFVTLIFCAAAVILGGIAIWMQIQVSGENLLTMDSSLGYILAVNYRKVTLSAVIVAGIALIMFAICIIHKLKHKKSKEQPSQ